MAIRTIRHCTCERDHLVGFEARFFVVCPAHNRDKFAKWVATAPFKEFQERYEFRTYQELFAFYKTLVEYTAIRSRFLRV